MTTTLRLSALFTTLLGTAAVAVGCSGDVATTEATDGGTKADAGGDRSVPAFDTTVCLDQNERNYLFPKDATLAVGIDFLGGFQVDNQNGPTTVAASPHKIGAACSKATDAKACTTALGAVDPAMWSWGSDCGGFCGPSPGYQVRTTAGDKVAVIGARLDVQTAFLPIDRPSEAVAAVAAVYGGDDCQGPNVRANGDGSYVVKTVSGGCATNPNDPTKSINYMDETAYRVTADGTITQVGRVRVSEVANDYGCPVAGRKPAGLAACAPSRGDVSGGYFAKMAHLEAASVVAFAHMVSELRAHGAPAALIARAEAAILDEERHAVTIGALAAEHGAAVPAVEVAPMAVRSLLEMAIENRREGCVRETFGALVAHYQAAASTERPVREAMREIAADETEHAALSWDLDAWFATRLNETERALVEAAGSEAACGLEEECRLSLDEEANGIVGLPPRSIGLQLFAGMREGLGLAA